jgi:hypothetical protein
LNVRKFIALVVVAAAAAFAVAGGAAAAHGGKVDKASKPVGVADGR